MIKQSKDHIIAKLRTKLLSSKKFLLGKRNSVLQSLVQKIETLLHYLQEHDYNIKNVTSHLNIIILAITQKDAYFIELKTSLIKYKNILHTVV